MELKKKERLNLKLGKLLSQLHRRGVFVCMSVYCPALNNSHSYAEYFFFEIHQRST